ncbi:transcriptional regulator, LacI family [Streptoalloteichus tenebrarius]|uniref:Transcriptional regulator, LacI family n=1 Tax=Streptoalloteichus tenebrarius (strain ATCC 17920 / DSM 40477 / JCM 4838 / CBS 697.72 / NBRC 16177 / NCIMB 11028 / NRRL B-12390 / A12253. 1 / ISP 5477) TaxID=1933 RepID=A0ABT1HQG6_STRSD|nr:LacI family DNA-binding transcriptional regulator [Streptoalloteichus tenebrarius]MCP2257743.1 transcriptional regulator, LacI family [Streptoalloteichus tenebrarius]BFE99901.1 substrate-binding domain-containing protein [Streptoalloteichus tenebrarius]
MPAVPGPRRRPTLDTVARAVGVSRATVSNAYNRPDQLSAPLRARILAVADQLGYPGPDPVARSLATRRSAAVAFVLATPLSTAFSDPALTTALDGLASTVDEHGHGLLLVPGTADAGPRPEAVARAQADVIVLHSLADDVPALRAAGHRRLPLLVIDQPVVPTAARVEIDDEGGAAAAAEHLLRLGHRRVGVLALPFAPDHTEGPAGEARRATARYRVSRDRLAGYLRTLGAVGADPDAPPVWEATSSDREAGRRGGRWLLGRRPRPTALLCMSDELALGAVRAAGDLGLSVPGDVSVVGFDDTRAAAASDPPLTTIHQPLAEKGRRAGEIALGLLAGDPPGPPVRLPTHLVVRSSTAPPR